jgi:hypothetical protein
MASRYGSSLNDSDNNDDDDDNNSIQFNSLF